MRLRYLCCVLSISLLSHPIHASSDPQIIASYLNWDIALFYDQNVKSCVAISKGNPYEHEEEEEEIEEEEVVEEEEIIEEEIEVVEEIEEEVIEEEIVALGAYDYGIEHEPELIEEPETIETSEVEAEPEYGKNLQPYEFGPFTDDIIIPISAEEEARLLAEAEAEAASRPLTLPAYNVEIAKIASQLQQETANEDGNPELVAESEQEGISDGVKEIDTEKLLAEAKAEDDKKRKAALNLKKGAFFITNWPQRREYFDISIRPQALLHTGKTAWLLFPDNSRFVLTQSKLDAKPNPYLRAEILKRLRQNRFAEVVNYDKDGELIRHYYDLQGINYALSALLRFCPLPHYPD